MRGTGGERDGRAVDVEHEVLQGVGGERRCAAHRGGAGLGELEVGQLDAGDEVDVDPGLLEVDLGRAEALLGLDHAVAAFGELLQLDLAAAVVGVVEGEAVTVLGLLQGLAGQLEGVVGGGAPGLGRGPGGLTLLDLGQLLGERGAGPLDGVDLVVAAAADAEPALALDRGQVALGDELAHLGAAAGDHLDLGVELGLAALLLGLGGLEGLGLDRQAGDLVGGVVEVAQQRLGLEGAGPGGLEPRGQRGTVAVHLAAGREVAVALGADALPQGVFAVAGTVAARGHVEGPPERRHVEPGLGELGALLEAERVPQRLVERLGEHGLDPVVRLLARELGAVRLEHVERGELLPAPALAVDEAVGPGRQLDLGLGALVAADGLDGLDAAVRRRVGVGEQQVDGLGERGLADLVVALDDDDAGRGEQHLGRDHPAVVAQRDAVEPHRSALARR